VAHCPPALLDDIADVLADVRTWPGIIEKSPGVFYARRNPFLHFHLVKGGLVKGGLVKGGLVKGGLVKGALVEGGRRRADVKGRAGWTSLDLPHPISAAKRRAFLRLLGARYREW
jgi:hypothetical protein